MACSCCTLRCSAICGVLLGIHILAAGLFVTFGFHSLIVNEISKEVPYTAQSERLGFFTDPPANITGYYYLWNLTNPFEFEAGNKPVFKQIGPFIFTCTKSRYDLHFHKNDTLSFKEKTFSHYDVGNPKQAPLDDIFYSVDVVEVLIATLVEQNGAIVSIVESFAKDLIGWSSERTLTRRYTTGGFLMGDSDNDIERLRGVKEGVEYWISKEPSEAEIPDFGMVVLNNGTPSGVINMYTGKADIDKFHTVDNYNHNTSYGIWEDKEVDKVKGQFGGSSPPGKGPDEPLDIFAGQLCRTLPLRFREHGTLPEYDTIPVYIKTLEETVWQSAAEHPPNKIFCAKMDYHGNEKPEGYCLDSGFINMQPCVGAPLLLSKPHFVGVAQQYVDLVEGLQPDVSKHPPEMPEGTIMAYVEPLTGNPMTVERALQTNIPLVRRERRGGWKNLPADQVMIIPLLWLHEVARPMNFVLDEMNSSLFMIVNLANTMQIPLICLGGILLALSLIIIIWTSLAARREKKAAHHRHGSGYYRGVALDDLKTTDIL